MAGPNKAALLLAIGGKPKRMGAAHSEPDEDEAGGPSDDDADNESPSTDDVKLSAADDVVAAIESGDRKALASALSDFVAACKDY